MKLMKQVNNDSQEALQKGVQSVSFRTCSSDFTILVSLWGCMGVVWLSDYLNKQSKTENRSFISNPCCKLEVVLGFQATKLMGLPSKPEICLNYVQNTGPPQNIEAQLLKYYQLWKSGMDRQTNKAMQRKRKTRMYSR